MSRVLRSPQRYLSSVPRRSCSEDACGARNVQSAAAAASRLIACLPSACRNAPDSANLPSTDSVRLSFFLIDDLYRLPSRQVPCSCQRSQVSHDEPQGSCARFLPCEDFDMGAYRPCQCLQMTHDPRASGIIEALLQSRVDRAVAWGSSEFSLQQLDEDVSNINASAYVDVTLRNSPAANAAFLQFRFRDDAARSLPQTIPGSLGDRD